MRRHEEHEYEWQVESERIYRAQERAAKERAKKEPLPPEALTEEERAYYHEIWAFDPVADKNVWPLLPPVEYIHFNIDRSSIMRRAGIKYYYESPIPLENDPELRRVGVTLLVRVKVDTYGVSHNRIVFVRGEKSFEIECVHIAVNSAPFQEILDLPEETLRDLVTSTKPRPAVFTPWEQFVALKSFVAGIAAIGIFWLLDPIPWYRGEKRNTTALNPPLSFGLVTQIERQLLAIAPDLMQPIIAQKFSDTLERAPVDWLIGRWEALNKEFHIQDYLQEQVFLNAISGNARKKMSQVLLHHLGMGVVFDLDDTEYEDDDD